MTRLPRAGEVYDITSAASVQFARGAGLRLRVIHARVLGSTPAGWAWVEGYVIDPVIGEATERREVFVQVDGLIPIDVHPGEPAGKRDHRNAGPARIPAQRTTRTQVRR